LTSFLENGLLHKIPDDSGIAKYALCHHEGTEHTHDDHHVHFKCKKCEKIECLHNLEIPKLHLPKKYKMEHANLLIEGICAYCNP
jgi:Fur family ferric uptake transcriptional regulator